ncbi:MAG: hypothetical protein MZW92_58025 [Comamonadaceae bacterium]|nr:hypothetical protein [Comamonadaceae bacterium]
MFDAVLRSTMRARRRGDRAACPRPSPALYRQLELRASTCRERGRAGALRYPVIVLLAMPGRRSAAVNIFVIPAFAKVFASFKARAAAADARADRLVRLHRLAAGR